MANNNQEVKSTKNTKGGKPTTVRKRQIRRARGSNKGSMRTGGFSFKGTGQLNQTFNDERADGDQAVTTEGAVPVLPDFSVRTDTSTSRYNASDILTFKENQSVYTYSGTKKPFREILWQVPAVNDLMVPDWKDQSGTNVVLRRQRCLDSRGNLATINKLDISFTNTTNDDIELVATIPLGSNTRPNTVCKRRTLPSIVIKPGTTKSFSQKFSSQVTPVTLRMALRGKDQEHESNFVTGVKLVNFYCVQNNINRNTGLVNPSDMQALTVDTTVTYTVDNMQAYPEAGYGDLPTKVMNFPYMFSHHSMPSVAHVLYVEPNLNHFLDGNDVRTVRPPRTIGTIQSKCWAAAVIQYQSDKTWGYMLNVIDVNDTSSLWEPAVVTGQQLGDVLMTPWEVAGRRFWQLRTVNVKSYQGATRNATTGWFMLEDHRVDQQLQYYGSPETNRPSQEVPSHCWTSFDVGVAYQQNFFQRSTQAVSRAACKDDDEYHEKLAAHFMTQGLLYNDPRGFWDVIRTIALGASKVAKVVSRVSGAVLAL